MRCIYLNWEKKITIEKQGACSHYNIAIVTMVLALCDAPAQK